MPAKRIGSETTRDIVKLTSIQINGDATAEATLLDQFVRAHYICQR